MNHRGLLYAGHPALAAPIIALHRELPGSPVAQGQLKTGKYPG